MSGRLHTAARRSALLLGAGLLSACVVGPNYSGPPETAPGAFARSEFRRAAVAPVVPTPPPARWWEAIGDTLLTRLIDDAFAASPTLKSAAARVRSARAQLRVDQTHLLPTGGTTASYVRARVPTGSLGALTGSSSSGSSGSGGSSSTSSISDPIKLNLYSVNFDASWELDLFGGTRRSIESAAATTLAQQAAFEDAQVQLASDVAKAYALLREAQSRVAFTLQIADVREREIVLTRQRRARGTAAEVDLQQLLDQSAQDRAGLPALQFQVDEQLDQLAILAGREPGAYDGLLAAPADAAAAQPLPPELVPVGEPADWLQRRPDIREAERTLAARTATIGQHQASYFPTLSLLGLIGTSGQHPRELFRGSPLTLLTPMLSWSFLNIPNTRAQVAGAEADRDEALGDYERTVVQALQDANDSLARYGRMRRVLVERQAALDAAGRAAGLVAQRAERGTASRIDWLDAERERLASEDRSAQARSNYLQAYVSLQKSLGLGWGAAPPADVARR